MSIEELNESSADLPAEPTEINPASVPIEPAEVVPEAPAETTTKWGLNRRKFLTAAALGTAAATLLNKGSGRALHLGPATALADDLSGLNCTANDVRIVGPGIILNEQCNCTGKFDAQVQFHIINNTGTDRYCVTVHLCPANANGTPIPQTDIVIGNIPANFDGLKTVTIKDYPCGSGLVCFGAAGSQPDGSFLKGEACPAGQCCTTITWNVKASDPCPDTTRQISSKCRHQQVCIQGRGATLSCVDDPNDPNDSCTPTCGGTATLKLCGSGGTKPYTFSLSDGTTTYTPSSTSSDGNCAFFKVTVTQTTTYTGTVTDSSSPTPCAQRSNSITLQATAVTPTISVNSSACNGVLTISTSVPGFSGCSFAYKIDGQAAANTETDTKIVRVNSDGTLSYRNLDNTCHTISVTATCGSCVGTASTTVKQACVVTTTGCTP